MKQIVFHFISSVGQNRNFPKHSSNGIILILIKCILYYLNTITNASC